MHRHLGRSLQIVHKTWGACMQIRPLTILQGFVTSVLNLYLHEVQRKRASKSRTPETEKGRPCRLHSQA